MFRTIARRALPSLGLLVASGLAGIPAATLAQEVDSPAAAPAAATPAPEERLEEILVLAVRDNRTSRGALVLPAKLVDTPQAVTVVDRGFIDDFGLNDANRVLGLVTGVNVEEVETDRTYYNSRGFDIKSMQVDAIGLPFNWNVVGALDTFVYDKIEVIRGANGLLTGTGNPSGTINYIRKRPTNDFMASAEISTGSWDERRVEGDISGPLTESGSWAGRLVGATQSGDSYLDLYGHDRTVVYGVLEGQVGRRGTVTLGYTQQDSESEGVLWGALPMLYTDGTQTRFDTSTSTSMNWTYWDTTSKTGFVEGTYAFPAGWDLKATLTYNDYEEPSELFYVYGSPGLDRDTGLGLYGYPGKYLATSERVLFDSTLTGSYALGGRTHDLVVGVNVSHSDNGYHSFPAPFDDPAWGALPAFPGWSGREIARPAFGDRVVSSDWETDVRRLFAVTRLRPTDPLDLIVGVNAINVESSGFSFDEPQDSDDQEVSPYVGIVYRFTDILNVYASYSDIYEPQPEIGADLQPLGAAEGTSYEAGLKGEFLDRRLLASLAVFRAEQDNYAEYAGFDEASGLSYYTGVDVTSEGYELELAGQVTDDWTVLAGFTALDLEDADGEDARTFVPRRTFNLGTRYSPSYVPGLRLGGSVKWQDDIHLESGAGTIRQDARAVWSAFAGYAIAQHFEVALNLDNLTDEKYLTSLYWDQAFYAAPRSVTASFRVTY
jgi:outer membrane receptor for ferric coprogen and ferric-rhodotorulic acid